MVPHSRKEPETRTAPAGDTPDRPAHRPGRARSASTCRQYGCRSAASTARAANGGSAGNGRPCDACRSSPAFCTVMSRVTSFKEVRSGMPDSNRQPPVPRLELYPFELIPCTGRVHTYRSIHTVRWVALVRRAGFNGTRTSRTPYAAQPLSGRGNDPRPWALPWPPGGTSCFVSAKKTLSGGPTRALFRLEGQFALPSR